VERLRDEAEKVPERVGVLHVRLWIALLGVDEVGELQRVAHEEHGRVVAHQIPITFLRVELEREAAGIPGGIRESGFTRHGGESGEHGRLLSDLTEDACLAQISHVPGDQFQQQQMNTVQPSTHISDCSCTDENPYIRMNHVHDSTCTK
jgi:hypothetical protein